MKKNMKKFNDKRGVVKTVILIVIALIILGVFGYNIKDILDKPLVKDNLNYAWNGVKYVWANYLATGASYFWNNIIVGLIWNNIVK